MVDLGSNEEALRCYDKSLEINSQDAGTWYNLGNCLWYLCRYEEVLRCYSKSLEIAPQEG